MESVLEVSTYTRPRFDIVLLSTFASIGLLLVIVGVYSVAIGLLLALSAANLLASQVWGISRYDPVTFSGVIAILMLVGLVASYLPSRRAARVDPAICLRSE